MRIVTFRNMFHIVNRPCEESIACLIARWEIVEFHNKHIMSKIKNQIQCLVMSSKSASGSLFRMIISHWGFILKRTTVFTPLKKGNAKG